MNYIIAGLAVYKLVQVVDALTPKEAMPWVKILFSILIGYVSTLFIGLEHPVLDGLAVATIAGMVHAVLRLLTLLGDWAQRRITR